MIICRVCHMSPGIVPVPVQILSSGGGEVSGNSGPSLAGGGGSVKELWTFSSGGGGVDLVGGEGGI